MTQKPNKRDIGIAPFEKWNGYHEDQKRHATDSDSKDFIPMSFQVRLTGGDQLM